MRADGSPGDRISGQQSVKALAGVLPGEALKLLSDQLNVLVTAPSEMTRMPSES